MGRFSQLQAEPEVRSCGPGHGPAPRQISFVEQRKTLPCSTPGDFYKVWQSPGTGSWEKKSHFFFFPLLFLWNWAPSPLEDPPDPWLFWQNVKLALECSDEPTARTFLGPCVACWCQWHSFRHIFKHGKWNSGESLIKYCETSKGQNSGRTL